jgi:N-acyl amino acid synthase of PEP-CTERM/exosortase system
MQSSAAVREFSPSLPQKKSQPASNDWFNVLPADTPELLDRAYQLRYQVYCRERGYEESGAFPDQRETDLFDNRSVHSLIVSRSDDAVLGTVRLVLADTDARGSVFPMQQICRNSRIDRIRPFPLSTTAEISRFAISKVARKKPRSGTEQFDCRARRPDEISGIVRPTIVLGLMKAILRMSREHGITDWLAVMEPSLLRLLAGYGIYFQPLGPLVEYHGMRQPCQANVSLLLERMLKERPDVWGYLAEKTDSLGSEKMICR